MENVNNYLLFVPKLYFALPNDICMNFNLTINRHVIHMHFLRLKVIFPTYMKNSQYAISILKTRSELQEETPKND